MNVDSPATYISLYSGGGGLDLGFRDAVEAQCVAYVEHEASAAALLVDHVEAELLDAAPVWTDAYTFPANSFHGLVDWIIGGPPCQPFSVAGKRLGPEDPRNLWPLTLRLVEQVQPRGCFFENVPSADSLWYIYEEVIPGLQHLGYEVEAGIFSAAEVGAPHNRERIFIIAADPKCGGPSQSRGYEKWCCPAENPYREADQLIDAVRFQRLPFVCRGHDGAIGRLDGLSRSQRLRLFGNGVVPQTAAKAFSELSRRFQ